MLGYLSNIEDEKINMRVGFSYQHNAELKSLPARERGLPVTQNTLQPTIRLAYGRQVFISIGILG